MKLQYVGDRRDFYKYDLLLALGRSLQLSGGLTVIPMLTPDEPSRKEGRLRNFKPKHRDAEVHDFVRSLVPHDPCELGRVADFFIKRGIPTRFVPEAYLEPGNRRAYLAAVEDHDLADSIVFLDPDIGMEVPSTTASDTRYLHYEDLKGIYGRMSGGSVLIVYQHMPHQPHDRVFHELISRLFEGSGISQAYFLDMGDIGFIVSACHPDRVMQVAESVGKYASSRRVGMIAAAASHTFGVRREDGEGDR